MPGNMLGDLATVVYSTNILSAKVVLESCPSQVPARGRLDNAVFLGRPVPRAAWLLMLRLSRGSTWAEAVALTNLNTVAGLCFKIVLSGLFSTAVLTRVIVVHVSIGLVSRTRLEKGISREGLYHLVIHMLLS